MTLEQFGSSKRNKNNEQVPHSGKSGIELPGEREFNTPLSDAFEQGLVDAEAPDVFIPSVEDSLIDLEQRQAGDDLDDETDEFIPSTHQTIQEAMVEIDAEKAHERKKQFIIGGAAAIAGAAVVATSFGVGSLMTNSNEKTDTPETEPTVDAPVVPGVPIESPVTIETPVVSPSALPGETASSPEVPSTYIEKAEQFDISVEEYTALVDSYKITPEAGKEASSAEMLTLITDSVNSYFAGGHTTFAEYNSHNDYTSHINPVNSGRNVYNTELHTAALQDALVPNATETPEWINDLAEFKRQANMFWETSIKAGDPGFVLEFKFNETYSMRAADGTTSWDSDGQLKISTNGFDNPSLAQFKPYINFTESTDAYNTSGNVRTIYSTYQENGTWTVSQFPEFTFE